MCFLLDCRKSALLLFETPVLMVSHKTSRWLTSHIETNAVSFHYMLSWFIRVCCCPSFFCLIAPVVYWFLFSLEYFTQFNSLDVGHFSSMFPVGMCVDTEKLPLFIRIRVEQSFNWNPKHTNILITILKKMPIWRCHWYCHI